MLVLSERVKLVCGLVTVTVALPTTPPLGSVTIPVICPNVCPSAGVANAIVATSKKKIESIFVRMKTHSFGEPAPLSH